MTTSLSLVPRQESPASSCSAPWSTLRWRKTATVTASIETTRARPLLVVPLTRSPPIRLLCLRSWPLGPFYRAAADELVHDDGIAERLSEYRVQMGHDGDGERLAVPASASQQVPVQLGDGGWPHILDRPVVRLDHWTSADHASQLMGRIRKQEGPISFPDTERSLVHLVASHQARGHAR